MSDMSRIPTQRAGGRHVRRPFAVAAAALGAASYLACSDSTAPPPPPADDVCPTATVPLCSGANAAVAAAARDAVADAVGRSTPALENAGARPELAASLAELEAMLAAGNVTRSRNALGRARAALTAAHAQLGTFPGDAPDLTAIELALDRVAPLLGVS